ncbi:7709_t:CDS:2 [Rhizophagus irregularis]|nr:7709_t:CDS:2 [Rhizophagus irregularis]
MKKSRFNSIFTKRPTKCCCCIPFRPGTIILCILLFINGIWNASIFLSEIAAYSQHTARGVPVLLGLFYFLVVPISIFGIYVTSKKNEKLIECACQNDLSYFVPSNSSTVQVAFDPNAFTKKQVDDACVQAVNLSLSWNLFDFIVFKAIVYFYFGAVVSAYSKNPTQIPTDVKINTNPDKEKNDKMASGKQELSLDEVKGDSIKPNDSIKSKFKGVTES